MNFAVSLGRSRFGENSESVVLLFIGLHYPWTIGLVEQAVPVYCEGFVDRPENGLLNDEVVIFDRAAR